MLIVTDTIRARYDSILPLGIPFQALGRFTMSFRFVRQGVQSLIFCGLAFAITPTTDAQFRYPGGYGRWGWGGWGYGGYGMGVQDPASGYAAGLGQLAIGQGQYLESQAKATSMNVDTKIKWNEEMRRLKLIAEADKKRKQAVEADVKEVTARERDVVTGVTANRLLDQILEGNTEEVISYLNKTALNPKIIREIPFEVSSEAISLCLHNMTSEDNVPNLLKGDNFAASRGAVKKAVEAILKEDMEGSVSSKNLDNLEASLKALRTQFEKEAPKFSLDYAAADRRLRAATSLARLLREPEYQKLLQKLETYEGTTVGDLVAFMSSFNLRFAAPTNDRQKEIYTQLTPMLASVPVKDVNLKNPEVSAQESAKALSNAAQELFDGISWRDLDLHAESMKPATGK